MPFEENLARLKKIILEIPEISDIEKEIITSRSLLDRILPLMTAFTAENVTQMQKVKDKTGEKMATLAEKILAAESSPEDIGKFTKDLQDGFYNADFLEHTMGVLREHWFWGPLASVVLTTTHMATLLFAYLKVSAERTTQIANKDIRPFLLDIETLVEEVFRNPNNYAWVQEEMTRMGISDEKIDLFLRNKELLLPLDALRLLYNRGIIDDGQLESKLGKLKFKPEDFDNIKATLRVYPGVQDLIMFAVREVFDEAFAQRAGLYEGIPTAWLEEVEKTGMSHEHARQYWAAHWTPPSVSQAFEMFHRKEIDSEELSTLLKVQDIMPNYRDKLKNIAYNTLTRVDIRRFYADGFISFEEMIGHYEAGGYSPEMALLNGEWTDFHYGDEAKERTKADVIKLYKLGTITGEVAFNHLRDIGYSKTLANEYIIRADVEQAEKRKNSQVKVWRKAFINHVYTEEQVLSLMRTYGMSKIEIDDLINEWESDRDSKIRHLGLKDIEKMFKAGLMDAGTVALKLQIQGYQAEDVSLLITLWSEPSE